MNLALIRAKANAHYQCQECGSTELIQAHHQIPGDDNSLIVLCAECHSKRHPDLPKALFFNEGIQPYWHNKSASSLARELKVHPRTIIRIAKRLGIMHGNLMASDEGLIKNAVMHRDSYGQFLTRAWYRLFQRKWFAKVECLQCNHNWTPVTSQYPYECQSCHSVEWDGENRERRLSLRRIEEGIPRPEDKIRLRRHKRIIIPKSEVRRLQHGTNLD